MEVPHYRPSDKRIFSKGSPWPGVNPTGQIKNYSPMIFCIQISTQFSKNSALI